MSRKSRPSLDGAMDELKPQVSKDTPEAVLEGIAVQLLQAREARDRIDREGSVVKDQRGSVIPHPAIKIELDAMRAYTTLLAKHRR